MTDRGDLLSLFVAGTPIAQGSKKHVGRGILIESAKGLGPWRKHIRSAVSNAWVHDTLDCPVEIDLSFAMPRPKAAPRRDPIPAMRRPDLDKLTRAVLDSMEQAGVYTDDARVVHLRADKYLARPGESPGVLIRVRASPLRSTRSACGAVLAALAPFPWPPAEPS